MQGGVKTCLKTLHGPQNATGRDEAGGPSGLKNSSQATVGTSESPQNRSGGEKSPLKSSAAVARRTKRYVKSEKIDQAETQCAHLRWFQRRKKKGSEK